MNHLSDLSLVEAYLKSIKLDLDSEFVQLLKSEMASREINEVEVLRKAISVLLKSA